MKQLNSRQLANNARMSLEKYSRSGDFQYLKDAHEILSEAIQREYDNDKQLTSKCAKSIADWDWVPMDASKVKVVEIDARKAWWNINDENFNK